MRGLFRLVKTAADPEAQGGTQSPGANPTPRPLRTRPRRVRPQEFWKEVLRADGEDIGDIIRSVDLPEDMSRIVSEMPSLVGMGRQELRRFLLLISHGELLPDWRSHLYDLQLQFLRAVTPEVYDENLLARILVRGFSESFPGVVDSLNPTLLPQLEEKYAEGEARHLVATGDLNGDLPLRGTHLGGYASSMPRVLLRAFVLRARGEGTFGRRGSPPRSAEYQAGKMLLEGYPPIVTAADTISSDPQRLFSRREGKGWILSNLPTLIGQKILSRATEEALVRWWETDRLEVLGTLDPQVTDALLAVRNLRSEM